MAIDYLQGDGVRGKNEWHLILIRAFQLVGADVDVLTAGIASVNADLAEEHALLLAKEAEIYATMNQKEAALYVALSQITSGAFSAWTDETEAVTVVDAHTLSIAGVDKTADYVLFRALLLNGAEYQSVISSTYVGGVTLITTKEAISATTIVTLKLGILPSAAPNYQVKAPELSGATTIPAGSVLTLTITDYADFSDDPTCDYVLDYGSFGSAVQTGASIAIVANAVESDTETFIRVWRRVRGLISVFSEFAILVTPVTEVVDQIIFGDTAASWQSAISFDETYGIMAPAYSIAAENLTQIFRAGGEVTQTSGELTLLAGTSASQVVSSEQTVAGQVVETDQGPAQLTTVVETPVETSVTPDASDWAGRTASMSLSLGTLSSLSGQGQSVVHSAVKLTGDFVINIGTDAVEAANVLEFGVFIASELNKFSETDTAIQGRGFSKYIALMATSTSSPFAHTLYAHGYSPTAGWTCATTEKLTLTRVGGVVSLSRGETTLVSSIVSDFTEDVYFFVGFGNSTSPGTYAVGDVDWTYAAPTYVSALASALSGTPTKAFINALWNGLALSGTQSTIELNVLEEVVEGVTLKLPEKEVTAGTVTSSLIEGDTTSIDDWAEGSGISGNTHIDLENKLPANAHLNQAKGNFNTAAVTDPAWVVFRDEGSGNFTCVYKQAFSPTIAYVALDYTVPNDGRDYYFGLTTSSMSMYAGTSRSGSYVTDADVAVDDVVAFPIPSTTNISTIFDWTEYIPNYAVDLTAAALTEVPTAAAKRSDLSLKFGVGIVGEYTGPVIDLTFGVGSTTSTLVLTSYESIKDKIYATGGFNNALSYAGELIDVNGASEAVAAVQPVSSLNGTLVPGGRQCGNIGASTFRNPAIHFKAFSDTLNIATITNADTTGDCIYQAVIYASDASGTVGTSVATSNQQTINAAGEYAFTFTGGASLTQNTYYWIAFEYVSGTTDWSCQTVEYDYGVIDDWSADFFDTPGEDATALVLDGLSAAYTTEIWKIDLTYTIDEYTTTVLLSTPLAEAPTGSEVIQIPDRCVHDSAISSSVYDSTGIIFIGDEIVFTDDPTLKQIVLAILGGVGFTFKTGTINLVEAL